MKIVAQTDEMDLRKVISKSGYLRKIAAAYNLGNREAVCFTNRAFTRFRLIMKVRNSVFLCIPEIDEASHLSVYLRISQELAHLSGMKSVRFHLNALTNFTRNRIATRLQRATPKNRRDRPEVRYV